MCEGLHGFLPGFTVFDGVCVDRKPVGEATLGYKYVCRHTYYEGRHTDLQVIFFCMAKTTDSKGKTLAAAARLFRQQGYHGTALHDILAPGGSPRGSLYFHFPKGKQPICEAALTLAVEAVRQ